MGRSFRACSRATRTAIEERGVAVIVLPGLSKPQTVMIGNLHDQSRAAFTTTSLSV
ncbi:hypothetical protein OKW29_001677 [Paraburkholderia sp. CI3]